MLVSEGSIFARQNFQQTRAAVLDTPTKLTMSKTTCRWYVSMIWAWLKTVTMYAIPSVVWMSDPIMRMFDTKSSRLCSISRLGVPSGYVMSRFPWVVRKKTHAERPRDRAAWPTNPIRIYNTH